MGNKARDRKLSLHRETVRSLRGAELRRVGGGNSLEYDTCIRAILTGGRVIAEGTPGQLKASVGSGALRVRLLDPEQRPEAERVLAAGLDSVQLEADPAALSAQCADAERGAEVVADLARSGIGIADFSLGQPSLDEVFMALTGHPAEDHDAQAEEEQAA